METFLLHKDIIVFGFQVKEFPAGISEAFDKLMKMVPDGFNRSYFGISYFQNDRVDYFVAVSEGFEGESVQYTWCEKINIAKGHYDVTPIAEWRTKTDMINDVFAVMMKDITINKSRPCIEWYKDFDEMYCMIRKD